MNLVCLDSHYFTWGILKKSKAGQEDLIPQTVEFFGWLDETKATVVVPTPIITELLMGADADERYQILSVLDSQFRVVEFDTLSAKYAADIWNTKKNTGVIGGIVKAELQKTGMSLRSKIKIDTLIIASAMAAKVNVIYTEDGDFMKLAEGFLVTRKMPLSSQLKLPFPNPDML